MRDTSKKFLYTALRLESRLVLWRYKPKIIAITGSVGKTSTKDAIYASLASQVHVRKSEKSYNSEIGLPLTVLGIPNGWNNPITWFKNLSKGLWLFLWPHRYPKWLVLEVGIGKPGDMKKTASWLKTDVVVMTAIGNPPAHIEFFESRKHLVEEKASLIKTLKRDGLLILNKDDETVIELKSKTKARTLSFGFTEGADLFGSEVNISYDKEGIPEGIVFRVDENGASLPVVIGGVFGKNHVYASLAALSVCAGLKLNMLEAINALRNYDVPPGRMRLLRGINGSLIIDDTYNSSPYACESALRTLGEVKMDRKIAVLGDMLELGKHTIESHQEIGRLASENADIILTVGPRAKSIKEGAREKGTQLKNIHEFDSAYDAADFLKDFVRKGDMVLIKGSQGMRMERIVASVLLDQEHKSKLLVRQDKEWLEKK